jgi:hypothetical protein
MLIEDPLLAAKRVHLLERLPTEWRDAVANKIRLTRRVGEFIVRDIARALREQELVNSREATMC